mgnify:CR=1 FL=1
MIPLRALAMLAALATSPAHAQLHAFIVSGLGGEPHYEQRFVEQAKKIAQAATALAGDPSRVVVLTGERARRDTLERELRAFADRVRPQDQVIVVMIGHGTFDGTDYRFNLPGPDMTGRELAALLDSLPAQQQLIVNTTSSSGAVIEQWKRPGRTLITATRSGGERNATRFAEFWVQALSSPEADRDKDDVVTAAEAFEFASRKVADAFKADAALATEHARMEGDRTGRFLVARLGRADAVGTADAELASLLQEQESIERQLEALRSRKQTLETEAYYDELEKVLVALARVDRRIDDRRAALGGARQARDAAAER